MSVLWTPIGIQLKVGKTVRQLFKSKFGHNLLDKTPLLWLFVKKFKVDPMFRHVFNIIGAVRV